MLDLAKSYRTRSGCEVRGLVRSVFGQLEHYPIRGEVLDQGEWEGTSWTAHGKTFRSDHEDGWDLIEVADDAPQEANGTSHEAHREAY